MIERVAEKIYEAMRYERRGITTGWINGGNSHAQEKARKTARIVIEAMREPTEEMVSRGFDCQPESYDALDDGEIKSLYKAMIDCASKRPLEKSDVSE